MEISIYLDPVSETISHIATRPGRNRFGETIDIHHAESFPDLENAQLAIIGVHEERVAINNEGCAKGVHQVREAFYQLFNHYPNLKMVDLGDIKAGYNVDDTYFALNQVVSELLSMSIVPIIIGGSQDLTFSMYQAYENTGQLVNIVAVDPLFDLGNDNEDLNSRSYLSHIVMHQPNYLFNFTNIGYQTYYIDYGVVDLMKNLLFDVYRLGVVKSKPEEMEPLVRNADILSFDISAIRAADAPGNGNAGPNGFTGEEACRLIRYAGLSSKISSIGFFEYNPLFDTKNVTADLIAQMIWYFIEGFMNRKNDYPTADSRDFARYYVKISGSDDIIFLRNKQNDRWWMDLSFDRSDRKKYERHHYIPCSKEDYDRAMREEIPDRWWQFYQKLM